MHPKVISAIEADVLAWFNLDETSVFNLKLDYGEKYLNDRYADQPETLQAMKQSAAFWLWWRELWITRDRELMAKCERKWFGFNYTYLLNGHIGQTRMQDTRRVYFGDVFDFYEDYHYWRKIDAYPNSVLVNVCVEKSSPGLAAFSKEKKNRNFLNKSI